MSDAHRNKISAIETRYAGCRFRSRTEARWAVAFDKLGLRWEYEKEGFNLPSGCYLPDFWFSSINLWIEIKGADPTELEKQLCRELRDLGHAAVLCLYGEIGTCQGIMFDWEIGESGGGSTETELKAMDVTSDGELYFALEGNGQHFSDVEFSKPLPVCPRFGLVKIPSCTGTILLSRSVDHRMLDALEAARSARFEHGESGAG